MRNPFFKGLLIGLTCLFVGCETNRLVDSGVSSSTVVPVERELPDSSLETVFTDNFEATSDQALSSHTSNSGHTYSGSDVTDFEIEASSNSLYSPGDPDGISSWWVTPDIQLSSSSYRSIIRDATLGGNNQYFHLFVGVRHDGEARGSENVYSLELAGGSVGIVLRRTNAGSATVLASDSSFTTNNSIDSTTTVDLELEAETIGSSVVLNGWITVDSGTRQHVFQDIQDNDADRITDTGSPAFGMSPIAPRIGKAEVLEEEISPTSDYWDNFDTIADQDLSNRTSSSGHTYSGSDVAEFVVESSTNSTYPSASDPGGNSAWWATPDFQPASSDYRSAMDVTMGSTENWTHAYVGVRHDGSLRGSETAYALHLRGGDGGLNLVRFNNGSETILDSISNFANNNNIGSSTPVSMELQAESESGSVELNAWITVDGGTQQHVFQVSDSDASRITDTGRPGYGQSINLARIHHAEILETVDVGSPEEGYSDDFETGSDQDLVNRTSSSGHTYSGSDVDEFVVESSTNSTYPSAGSSDGNSDWWATPDFQSSSSDYRSVMEITLGSTENWTHTFVGVRHDGASRGSETVYSLHLRGGDGGIALRRHNNGTETVLDSDPNFTTNNGIGASTPVVLELQAETGGSAVNLSAWVTVDGGTRQHVFHYADESGSRITDTGRPSFGQSINLARIHEGEILNIDDVGDPPPSGGSGDPVDPEPPLLSTFENYMVDKAKDVGDWQQSQTDQNSQYYDGLRTHQQIRDYAQANMSGSATSFYLNNVSSYISRSITVVRDNYVIPNGGVVDDWRRFPKGLYYHYQETGDQDSYDAALMLRDGRTVGTGDPISHPEFGHASWIREMSYWLQAHTWGEKLDGTRDVAEMQTYIDYLENHLYQMRNNDYSSPSRHSDRDGMQSFYVGLAGIALIEWYEFAGNTYWPTDNWATIPDALKDIFGWMIDQGPSGAKVVDNGYSDPNIGEPFYIENYDGTSYGTFRGWDRKPGSTGGYHDVNNLITPVYWWIGNHFDDAEFIELGDKVFAGAVTHANIWNNNNRGKVLGQHHLVALDGLRWRQEYVDRNN